MNDADSRTFFGTLIGDGRPLIVFTALALVFAGIGAIFLSVTGHFLPHDVEFLGMQPSDLCRLNECKIVHFMIHDRMSFGGVILSIAVLYLWLALFPLRDGESWAWWILVLTNATGFGSFLAYMGYGYLDHWHAWATGGLLPVALWGLCRTRKLCTRPLDFSPAWSSVAEARARLPWFGWGLGTVAAGITILIVGMTQVFVPSDLDFLGYTRAELDAINPRLIPLIAHDRAGFGGGLLTTGLLLLGILWKAPMSRHLWQALVIAGVIGFGCAIGVHYPIGYLDFWHLAPAWAGAVIFAIGAWSTWRKWKVVRTVPCADEAALRADSSRGPSG